MKTYGITEKIKSELDALTLEVADAQFETSECGAAVQALTEKANQLQNWLTYAKNVRDQAQQHQVMVSTLVQQAHELKENAKIADREMSAAGAKTHQLSLRMKGVIDKLIYSAEVANKLANLVSRKKALNPLISDELITALTKAGTDANNIVALALVALQAVFTVAASAAGSSETTCLTSAQAASLYHLLAEKEHALNALVTGSCEQAKLTYEVAKRAMTNGAAQLNKATSKLNRAQVRLQSLQAGLAAANAAASAG